MTSARFETFEIRVEEINDQSVCLCNYPNVPSVPSNDWLSWLNMLYGIEGVNERNTMFIHFLVWDKRYAGQFLKELLSALFGITTYCLYVILVLPPWVAPVDAFNQDMIRVTPKNMEDSYKIQSLYLSIRHRSIPRSKIRRVVEEDNDDVVNIIHTETTKLKEFYGEYYVSEMARQSNACRQLIVSQDVDGVVTGVMCINRTVDVDAFNENFELSVYNHLRKPCETDGISPGIEKVTSDILHRVFADDSTDHKQDEIFESKEGSKVTEDFERGKETLLLNDTELENMTSYLRKTSSQEVSEVFVNETKSTDSIPGKHETNKTGHAWKKKSSTRSVQFFIPKSTPSTESVDFNDEDRAKSEITSDRSIGDSRTTFLSDLPSITDYFKERLSSKRTSSLIETTLDPTRGTFTPTVKFSKISVKDVEDISPPQSIHYGKPNAFILEIFVMPKGISKTCSQDFFEAAFECFPDLDYCILLAPFPRSFSFVLDNFLHVPLRYNKDFSMNLYLTHRAIFFGRIKSREGESYDRKAVEEFLREIPTNDKILIDFDEATDPYQCSMNCYVFEHNDIIIGMAITCVEEEINFIRNRYHIEDYISMENVPREGYSRILHFILMPIFSVYHRFFFREIMRLSGFTVLFYRLYESDESSLTRKQPLPTCLSAMISVSPRRRIEYTFRDYTEMNETDENSTEIERKEIFSLFITTPRLAMIPNLTIDAKIVIIGASDCGVALAEYLALGSSQNFIHFTNLTLISPNGLPFDSKRCDLETNMIPFKGRYCHEYRHLVAGRAWINLVYGMVIAINRKDKSVTVLNQGTMSYDYLILTCGLQYQKPEMQKEIDARKTGKSRYSEMPWNCLTVNDDTEASICLSKIRSITNNLQQKKTIIFYGHNIDCYCTLRSLIKFGVKGSWIVLMEPPLNPCETHDSVFFNDCEVDVTIMNGIIENGVKVLLGWNLISWALEDTERGIMIKSVTLESKSETMTLDCDAFFNFGAKTINEKTFLAISRAGLMFDGQLVIDPECRTNDPFIFAAGTATKYSRKFYAESWQHTYYNSIEVGERLGKIIRKVICAHQNNEEMPSVLSKSKLYLTLPVFREPIIISCILPGEYHYLHVRKPAKRISRKIAIRRDFYGDVMVTGSCTSEIGYFRMRLNHYNIVETITCVHKKSFEVQHMIALYGKHESMLNDLKSRFKDSLIWDFYAYFREPWAAAIFYDRFECLRVENRATLLSRTSVQDDSLIDDCIRALIKSNWERISKEDQHYLELKYAGSVYEEELQDSLIDFLQFSEDALPMYCNPRKQRCLYADIEDSSLFIDQ